MAVSTDSVNYIHQLLEASTEKQKLSNFEDALHDVELAVVAALEWQAQALVAHAQCQRAIILYRLNQFGNANFVFGCARTANQWERHLATQDETIKNWDETCMRWTKCDQLDKRITTWEAMNAAKMKSTTLPDENITVYDVPGRESVKAESLYPTPKKKATVSTNVSDIHHFWDQDTEFVIVTLNVAGLTEDDCLVDFDKRSFSLSFWLPDRSTYLFGVDPLFERIDHASSTTRVFPDKVVFQLAKAKKGQNWSMLESQDPAVKKDSTALNNIENSKAPLTEPAVHHSVFKARSVPT